MLLGDLNADFQRIARGDKKAFLSDQCKEIEENNRMGNTRDLQQYVNCELPDVQGFRKGRGTRDQIANICWIIEKARKFQKNIYFCFIDYAKAFHCVGHKKLENSERDGNTRPPDLPLQKPICRSGNTS